MGAPPYRFVGCYYTIAEILHHELVYNYTEHWNIFCLAIRAMFLLLLMRSVGALDRLMLYGIREPLSRLRKE